MWKSRMRSFWRHQVSQLDVTCHWDITSIDALLVSWSCLLLFSFWMVFGHSGERIYFTHLPVLHVLANRQKTPCICSVLVGQLERIEHRGKNMIKDQANLYPKALQHLFHSVQSNQLSPAVTTQVRYSECIRAGVNLRLQALAWPSSVPRRMAKDKALLLMFNFGHVQKMWKDSRSSLLTIE